MAHEPVGVGFIAAAGTGLWLGLFAEIMVTGTPLFRFGGVRSGRRHRRSRGRPPFQASVVADAAVVRRGGCAVAADRLSDQLRTGRVHGQARRLSPACWPAVEVAYTPLRWLIGAHYPLIAYVDWCSDRSWDHRRVASN